MISPLFWLKTTLTLFSFKLILYSHSFSFGCVSSIGLAHLIKNARTRATTEIPAAIKNE